MENKIGQTQRLSPPLFLDPKLAARYLIAGGFGALINIMSMYVFVDIFSVWYIASAIFSFLISLVVTFFLQKMWTFRDKKLNTVYVWRQARLYIFSSVSFLFLNLLMLYIMVDFLNIGYLFAQFLSLGIVAFGSFLFNKAVTFKKVEIIN